MALETLLLSNEPELTQMTQRVMQDIGIDVLLTTSVDDAAALLGRRKFDALVIDCDGLPESLALLPKMRQGGSNRTAIVFAVLSAPNGLQRGFAAGANFVLERPLAAERMVRSIRAAMGLMVRERRRYFRLEIEVPVSMDFGDGALRPMKTCNISEGGFAVRASQPMPVGLKVKIRITLADQVVECKGEIAWSTEEGRSGVRLVAVSDAVRQQLAAFIAANCDHMIPLVSNGGRSWSKATV